MMAIGYIGQEVIDVTFVCKKGANHLYMTRPQEQLCEYFI
jgi:hypothetical protein